MKWEWLAGPLMLMTLASCDSYRMHCKKELALSNAKTRQLEIQLEIEKTKKLNTEKTESKYEVITR